MILRPLIHTFQQIYDSHCTQSVLFIFTRGVCAYVLIIWRGRKLMSFLPQTSKNPPSHKTIFPKAQTDLGYSMRLPLCFISQLLGHICVEQSQSHQQNEEATDLRNSRCLTWVCGVLPQILKITSANTPLTTSPLWTASLPKKRKEEAGKLCSTSMTGHFLAVFVLKTRVASMLQSPVADMKKSPTSANSHISFC